MTLLNPFYCYIVENDYSEGSEEKNFQIKVDVKYFKPEEISINVVNNQLLIECKYDEHDERVDISRTLNQRFFLPDSIDIKKIESKLCNDGILIITAPYFDQKIPINIT